MKARVALALLAACACAAAQAARPGTLAADRIESSGSFTAKSRDFAGGAQMPKRFTSAGDSISPNIAWSDLPEGTKSLALIMEDADAGSKPFAHWVVWNIDPAARSMAAGSVTPGARVGRNGRGTPGYSAPQPPGKPHHYHFQLFALDAQLELKPGATRDQLLSAMQGRVLGEAVLVGTYAKP